MAEEHQVSIENLSFIESKWFEYSGMPFGNHQKHVIKELSLKHGFSEVCETLEFIKYKHFLSRKKEGIIITAEMVDTAFLKLSQALFMRSKENAHEPKTHDAHSIQENDCYGDKKIEVAQNYYLTPIAYLKLIAGQKKIGCCGELKDRFAIFNYTHKETRERGVFFVGYDCAKQIIDLLNIKKIEASQPLIELPPLFDPMGKKGFITPVKNMLAINKDVLELILMLASLWDIQDFKGKLPYLLGTIWRNPQEHIGKEELIALNKIVGKDFFIADEKCANLKERIETEKKALYCPPLFSLRAVMDFMINEKMVLKSYI